MKIKQIINELKILFRIKKITDIKDLQNRVRIAGIANFNGRRLK